MIIELLRENPEHAHYYGRYAQLMLRTLNVAKSRQLALEGLKYDPDSVECLSAQVVCDFIERPGNSASQALQQLLVRHPQSAHTLLLIVIALEQRGDRSEALSIARELLRAQPDNEELVDLVKQLRLVTHWSMLPLWPVLRFGWAGSVGIWLDRRDRSVGTASLRSRAGGHCSESRCSCTSLTAGSGRRYCGV